MPQPAFLFSIAGLSVTLVGFSGLVAALRRDQPRTPLVTYRLRQIPEMALASALVALITLPLIDATHDSTVALRIACVVALTFTVAHMLILYRRIRTQVGHYRGVNWVIAITVDLGLLAVGMVALVTATAAAFEWLLVFMVARPAIAFVMALTDVTEG